MNFIKQTRLVKTDDGTANSPSPIVPTDVLTSSLVTENKVLLLKTYDSSIPEEKYGAYELKYDLQVFYQINIKGVTFNGFLVYDVDFWKTKADFDSKLAPALRNTFILQPTGKDNTDYQLLILDSINDYLIRVSLTDRGGDERDIELLTIKPLDSKSLYNNPDVVAMRNTTVEKI